jgi:NADH-quinone oxidoreductase subunit J
MTDALIALFGILAIVFAGLVLTQRQPMRAALALVAHMISLAAIYACLEIHVVALFQVLIYVGAVMVFMIYTIMLLDDRDPAYRRRFSRSTGAAVAIAAGLAVALFVPLLRGAAPAAAASVASFSFPAFSAQFMRHYWFHFELATVLLVVGMVAAWAAIREAR